MDHGGGRTRPPPDVEQALSSMLWTPYDRTSSESSSDEADDVDDVVGLGGGECKRRPPNKSDAIYYRPASEGGHKWWRPTDVKPPAATYNPSSRYSFPLNFNYYHPTFPAATLIHSSSMNSAPNDNSLMHFMIPPRAEVQTTSMVHSFTDNFVQYQQEIVTSNCTTPAARTESQANNTMAAIPVAIASVSSNTAGTTAAAIAAPSSLLYHRNGGGVVAQHTSSFIDFTTKIKQQILANNLKKRQQQQADRFNVQTSATFHNNSNNNTTMSLQNTRQQTHCNGGLNGNRNMDINYLTTTKTTALNYTNLPFVTTSSTTTTTSSSITTNVSYAAATNSPTAALTAATRVTQPILNQYDTLFASRGTSLVGGTQSVEENKNYNFSSVRDVNASSGDSVFNACDNNNNLNNNINYYYQNNNSSVDGLTSNLNCSDYNFLTNRRNDQKCAMRLNVPGAPTNGVADELNCLSSGGVGGNNNNNNNSVSNNNNNINNNNSRTSVYVPSNQQQQQTQNKMLSTGTIIGTIMQQQQPQPQQPPKSSVTIHVNQCDQNSQQQNDVVNNQLSGVSIVNCYRAVPVQIVHNNNNLSEHINNNNKNNNNNNSVDSTNDTKLLKHSVNLKVVVDKVNHNNIESDKFNENNMRKNEINEIKVVNKNANQSDESNGNKALNQMDMNKRPAEDQRPANGSGSTQADNDVTPTNRSFMSTEAQTEDTTILEPVGHGLGEGGNTNPIVARMERRRERRERRQARNRQQHNHSSNLHAAMSGATALTPSSLLGNPPNSQSICGNFEILPDILHNHLPPPYTTLPLATPLVPPIISTVPVVTAADCRYTFPLPVIRRSPSERSGKGCCGQWFAGPPLRALIAVVALGGVACALGGAALGATGLAGPPASHLTAALLMIGVGVILVTVSGAAWRMTAPGSPPCLGLGTTADLGRCGRRPCGRGGGTSHGLLYPEFQHRPPPPSYQASMQEYRLRLLLLDRDRQSNALRTTSPPPTYRSNAGSLLRAPLSTRYSNSRSSLFGGLSGIISGAVSNNNIPATATPAASSPAATLDNTLPPSYRSRHAHHPAARPHTSIDENDIQYHYQHLYQHQHPQPPPPQVHHRQQSLSMSENNVTIHNSATAYCCGANENGGENAIVAAGGSGQHFSEATLHSQNESKLLIVNENCTVNSNQQQQQQDKQHPQQSQQSQQSHVNNNHNNCNNLKNVSDKLNVVTDDNCNNNNNGDSSCSLDNSRNSQCNEDIQNNNMKNVNNNNTNNQNNNGNGLIRNDLVTIVTISGCLENLNNNNNNNEIATSATTTATTTTTTVNASTSNSEIDILAHL